MTRANQIEQRMYDLENERNRERDLAREARQTGHGAKARTHDQRAESAVAELKRIRYGQ